MEEVIWSKQQDIYSISTLEKLCVVIATAKDAFKLLYKIAISDHPLKDSASMTFLNLCQARLAETCLDLEQRFDIFTELEVEEGTTELLIKAFERALKANNFIGYIQFEESKNRDRIFQPTDDQLNSYFIAVIRKLKNLALDVKSPFSKLATDSLLVNMYDQLAFGCFDEMLEALKSIIEKNNGLTSVIRQKLTELSFKEDQFSVEQVIQLRSILRRYEPIDNKEILTAYVAKAPWLSRRDEHNNYINVSTEKARNLALQYVNENLPLLTLSIKVLLKGEQRQTFHFAEIIGKRNTISENKKLLNIIIYNYNTIPKTEQNTSFISGLVVGAKDEVFTRLAIEKLISSINTEIHAIRLIRNLDPIKYEDLLKIKNKLFDNPDYLRNLEYLDLSHLTDSEVINFVGWIKELNYSFALEVLYEIIWKENARWEGLKETINDLIYVEDITEYMSFINNSLHIESLIRKSINDTPSDKNIRFMINEIIKKYKGFNIKNESLLNSLTFFLIKDHWSKSWPLFGQYLTSESGANYKLKMTLEDINFDNENLYTWAKSDPHLYAPVAISLMDVFERDGGDDLKWNQFAKKLIDSNGSNSDLLDNVKQKFTNYSITRISAAGLYKRRLRLISELTDHDIAEVKIFAKNMIEYLKLRIKEEERFDANYNLGY